VCEERREKRGEEGFEFKYRLLFNLIFKRTVGVEAFKRREASYV
jgi:hypothetical protein